MVHAYHSIADAPAGHIDRVTFYLPPALGLKILPEIVATRTVKKCGSTPARDGSLKRWPKPARLGLNVIAGCSIVDLGMSPEEVGV